MKLLPAAVVLALISATPSVNAIPLPETHFVSPFATRFTRRSAAGSAANRLRSSAPGLVLRIPDSVDRVARTHENDIFLARALEDPIFAPAQDFALPPRADEKRVSPLRLPTFPPLPLASPSHPMRARLRIVLGTFLRLLHATSASGSGSLSIVKNSGVCETTPGVGQVSGYIDMPGNASMWFWFFEARNTPESAPLTLWLNGGPGCASMIGLFQENGPCSVNPDGKTTTLNPYSWNNISNMLYIDQPLGAGFSYGTGDAPVTNTDDAAVMMWAAFQVLFASDEFAGFRRRPLIFATESYGARFGPAFITYFNAQNALIDAGQLEGYKVAFKALMVNDGKHDPLTQYASLIRFARDAPGYGALQSTRTIAGMQDAWDAADGCEARLKACYAGATEGSGYGARRVCKEANDICMSGLFYPAIRGYDSDDLQQDAHLVDPFPYTYYKVFLKRKTTMEAIGARGAYDACSDSVQEAFAETGEFGMTSLPPLAALADAKFPIFIWVGDADIKANWLGVHDAMVSMSWYGNAAFNNTAMSNWTLDGEVVAEIKSVDAFTFSRVFGAGHNLPAFVPNTALQFFAKVVDAVKEGNDTDATPTPASSSAEGSWRSSLAVWLLLELFLLLDGEPEYWLHASRLVRYNGSLYARWTSVTIRTLIVFSIPASQMPSRRPKSHSQTPDLAPRPKQRNHRPSPSIEQPRTDSGLGMSPEARYEHNLKVLRRRDPSIISIFDQFTHVCVYHHNGEGWEKNGFEGSMFLYERNEYPPYGFYILNRMGNNDYVQRLYPEETAARQTNFLQLNSWPEYTNRRLEKIHNQYGNDLPDKFSEAWFPTDHQSADKGRTRIIYLWMFPQEGREPMIDVMLRLQSYVQKNLPYPEQYRFGPSSPPPNPRPSPPLTRHAAQSQPPQAASSAELDQLFSKLAQPQPNPTTSVQPTSVTVASLFQNPGAASSSSSSGIPLLNSIFASVMPASAPSAPQVHSPTPQVLNNEVITSLLGAATLAHALGRVPWHSSESSTVLDPDEELQVAGASAGRPLLSSAAPRATTSVPNGTSPRVVHGDATPRAPLPRTLHPPPPRPPAEVSGSQRPSSELWAPVDDRAEYELEDGEILELDFADTSALSDPAAFQRARQQSSTPDPIAISPPPVIVNGNGTRRGKGRKKGRKERAAERERARLAQEQLTSSSRSASASPDLVTMVAATQNGNGYGPASASASASTLAPFVEPETPTTARPPSLPAAGSKITMQTLFASASAPALNGNGHNHHHHKQPSPSPVPAPAPASKVSITPAGLDPAVARDAIISSVSAPQAAQRLAPRMERNEFVREVLTLIHTDSSFVNTLYQEYIARCN
ncbi:Serine carboxypeptidase S10 [Mycena kentingensis (nom. inval.)]|nr:Serine carboxypeptidase S10 [Mycena kentingensis (nom. inval.)]